jgi:hypothetical protein
MADIFDNVEAGFSSAVQRLQNAAAQFSSAYSQFIAIPVQYRSSEWQTVKTRADTTQGIISTFTNAIDSAYRWLQSAFGLSGLGQLGIIPAIPWLTVAAVGGAISAIMLAYSYMIEELNKSAYKKQLMDLNVQRVEQGLEPLDLTKLSQTGTGIFGDAASLTKWVVIGGALFFVVPKLIEKYKGR